MCGFLRYVGIRLRAFFALFLSLALACALALPLLFPLSGLSGAGARDENNASATLARKKNGGVYTLYSASSGGTFTKVFNLSELLSVRGEAAAYEMTGTDEVCAREASLNEILEEFSADVRFKEQVKDVISYYCYSAKIGSARAKNLGGEMINLHVAFRNNEAIVGVPLIFCGY